MKLKAEEVYAAADALVERGEEPTQLAVREACGNRGSETTINKHLRDWRAAREAAKVAIASELSAADQERALVLVASMQSEIRGRFETELARRHEDHLRREAALSAELDDAAEETERLVAERDAALANADEHRIAAKAMKHDLSGAVYRIRILEHEKTVLESRLAEAEKYSERLANLAEMFGLRDAANDDDTASEQQSPAA